MISRTNPIKVVHLAKFDVAIPVFLGNYVRYLRNQGYDVSIISHPGNWLTHDTTIMDGFFVKIMPFEPRISPLADLKTLVRLILYFRQQRFEIVHTHMAKPSLLGGLAARIAGVPVVVHTLHGLYLHESLPPFQYRFMVLIAKFIAMSSHVILSQNKQDIETCLREGICPTDKIEYLGNGIDLGRFNPDAVRPEKVNELRASLGIMPQQPAIGIVARMVREKGIYEFLEAARILKSRGVGAKYLIVGTHEEGKSTSISPEELVREYGLEDDTLILGFRDDVPELISLMNVVVLPSYGFEGMPRILMESAALAKPVVGTYARGVVDIVEDGVTGLLVPVQDAEALAQSIHTLLLDPELAAELGRNGRQRALKHFDERAFFRKTDLVYRQQIEDKLRMDPGAALKPVPRPGSES